MVGSCYGKIVVGAAIALLNQLRDLADRLEIVIVDMLRRALRMLDEALLRRGRVLWVGITPRRSSRSIFGAESADAAGSVLVNRSGCE